MKRIISYLLIAVMLLSMVPLSAFTVSAAVSDWDGTVAVFEEGSGTEDDPYLITSAQELAYLAQTVNSGISYEGEYFKLTTNIRLNDETFTYDSSTGLVEVTDGTNVGYIGTTDATGSSEGVFYTDKNGSTGAYTGTLSEWSPIGNTPSNYFGGHFDGDGHTIYGMYRNYSTSSFNSTVYTGFFGYIKNGSVKNLSVENAFYRYKGTTSGSYYFYVNVGGIAGGVYNGTIKKCRVISSTVIGHSYNASSDAGVGAIVGYISSQSSTVANCYSDSFVKATGSSAGGIVGCYYRRSNSNIENCYNSGIVNGIYAGGICGAIKYYDSSVKLTVSCCYNVGTISGSSYAGGILGYSSSSSYYVTASNCYYKMGSATYGSTIAQGIGGYDDKSGQCQGYTAGNLKKQENYVGFDFDNVWKINSDGEYPYPTLRGMSFADPDTCVHAYETVVTAPTCDASGYTTYTCAECGYSYTDNYVSALGHDYASSVTAPTCTEQGYTTYTCSTCGDSYKDTYVSALGHTTNDNDGCTVAKVCSTCGITVEAAKGHNYVTTVVEPTCTEQGYTLHACSECDSSYKEAYVRAKGHTPGEEADCENAQICTACGETIVDALGHNYIDTVTAPTCTTRGYTLHTCTDCGSSYKDSYVSSLGHTAGAAADCENDQTCTVCGEVIVSALGHNYESVVTAPTCDEDGYTTHTCTDCGDSYVDSYVDASHTPGEEADCENAQTCTVCGTELAPALGHDYESVVTEPDCENGGYTTYTCANCGDSYVADEVDALGHTEDSEWVTLPDGSKELYCAVCGELIGTVPAPYATGDVNGDGKVNMFDYMTVKSYYFDKITLTDEQLARADISGDNTVNMFDYIAVKKIVMS